MVTAVNIGGPGGDTNGAWGQLTIAGNANVTATNGISGGSTAWGINLDGGTLTTKGIDYGPHSYLGTTNIKFNGTLIKANQNNASFITASTGLDFAPDIQAGGAKIDSNGHSIGIGIGMGGTGALTKSGNGTLNLNVANTYSGGTIVNGGTLSLNHEQIGVTGNTAIGAATSSNTVTINNGGTLTGTKNNWLSNTGLASGGANAISVAVNLGGKLQGGSGFVTGLGNVTLSGGTIEVTNGLGAYGWNASFTLGGDITVSGSTASSITTASGAGATANIYMANGSNGTGGTRTFTVNNVTGNAASDLIVSARLANGTVIKAGAGTLEMATGATGTETAVAWQVNAGKLQVNSGVTVGAVSVAAGTASATPLATLTGNGTIGGNVVMTAESSTGFKNGGVLAPTAAASGTKLSVAGSTNFGTGSIFEWNMSATTPSSDPGVVANSGSYGQLAGTGSITGSNAVFSIVLGSANAFTDAFWNTDKSWNNVFTGAGASLNLSSIFSSISGTGITYNESLSRGEVGTEGYFTFNGTGSLTWTAVPEPTSALAGLLLTAGLLRRRRN